MARNQAGGAGPTPDYYRLGIADAREAPERAGVFATLAIRISIECAWQPLSTAESPPEHQPAVRCFLGSAQNAASERLVVRIQAAGAGPASACPDGLALLLSKRAIYSEEVLGYHKALPKSPRSATPRAEAAPA